MSVPGGCNGDKKERQSKAQENARQSGHAQKGYYYSHQSVATIRLEFGTLRVGDVIHIRGHTTDFSQKVESLEVNHALATEVGPNDDSA